MRRCRFATVLALGCTGPVLAWGAAELAGPAAASSADASRSARQPSPTSRQEVSPAAAPTRRAAAGGDRLARARSGLAEREYWASLNHQGPQAPNRVQNLPTDFEPSGTRLHDQTAEGSRGLLRLSLVGVCRGEGLAPLAPGEVVSEARMPASSSATRGQEGHDFLPAGDNAFCNVWGDDAPAEDGSDCDVADIYALSRFIAGKMVTLENVCKPYFDSP